MSEEAVIENEDTGAVEGNEDEVEYTASEQSAMDQGWRPQDEWDGPEDGWVDAKEFLFRGELMSRIQNQSTQIKSSDKKINELSDALKQLGEINRKTAEKEYDRALKALRKERSVALSDEEHDTVADIENRIDDLKESKKEMVEANPVIREQVQPDRAVMEQEFRTWASQPENTWYQNDPVLRGAADAMGEAYFQQNPGVDLQAVLTHVSKQIRKEMPHKFGNSRRSATSVTEKGTANKGNKGKSKFSKKDLNEMQLSAANTFVKSGALESVQAYVDALVASGDLG